MPQRAYFYPDMDLVQSASPGITVTQGSFKKVPSVLSSLVEEPEKRHAVPNHLLESSKFLLSDCSQTCGISRTHLLLFFFFETPILLLKLQLPESPNYGRGSQERNSGCAVPG